MGRRARQNRSRLKIMNDILWVARNGARKTHIMYRANLSYDQVNEYLSFLLDSRLIEEEVDRKYEYGAIYKVTQSGREFLGKYSELQDILAHPQLNQVVEPKYLDLSDIGE